MQDFIQYNSYIQCHWPFLVRFKVKFEADQTPIRWFQNKIKSIFQSSFKIYRILTFTHKVKDVQDINTICTVPF